MSYTFSTLSPADFEDLVRDLIGRELGVRFEAFCAGPDGGIDGRHAPSRGSEPVVLQAKHYEGSTFPQLQSVMKRERAAIGKLTPSRYLLATSRKLTPGNKKTLSEVIDTCVVKEGDIFGPDDLNGLLRKYPEVEKSHIGLWLSSTAVLERVVRSAAQAYANITKADIEKKVRVYAQNSSFTDSAEKLEDHHVLIISGPPGVGKTTLAEMLSYAYIGNEWELVPMRSLDDGFASISDPKKQILFFDDFLGKVALDKQALAYKDSDFARLVNRIRESANARFVLTTRAYIFEEARRVSEHLADERIDVTKYVLDVGTYTRRIKARILYNHLVVAETPKEHVKALVSSGKIPKIVDHKNYNPRVVEWMTDAFRLRDVKADEYPGAFLSALKNPRQLWDTAFRTHIDDKCQHLLFAMFFCSEYGVGMEELRVSYSSLHNVLSERYGIRRNPKDFEEAIRILEGSFISISNHAVSYVNPSFRDYLTEYLDDFSLLCDFASSARKVQWAKSLWKFGVRRIPAPSTLKWFATAFVPIAAQFDKLPVWKRTRTGLRGVGLSMVDAANADRISLLLDWWYATEDQRFADYVRKVMAAPVDGFSAWLDGTDLVRLLAELPDPDYGEGFPHADELICQLESALIGVLDSCGTDDLEKISDAVDVAGSAISPLVATAVENAILAHFESIEDLIDSEQSDAALQEYISSFRKWGNRFSIPQKCVDTVVSKIEERIQTIQDEDEPVTPESPSFKASADVSDKFDDEALENLFRPLLGD